MITKIWLLSLQNVFLDDDLVLDKISFKDDAQDMGELVLNPLEMTLILSFW